MSTLVGAGTPTTLLPTDQARPVTVELAPAFAPNETIASLTLVVEYSSDHGRTWAPDQAGVLYQPVSGFVGQTSYVAFLGHGSNPVGYYRLAATITTNAIPPQVFTDRTEPPIPCSAE